MSFHLFRNLASKFAVQMFRFQGQLRLRRETQPDFWHSDFARALHHLKKAGSKSPSWNQLDWNRISSLGDLHRAISIDAGQGPINPNERTRNRRLAFAPTFSLLANWNRWDLFENRWLVASSVYESSIRWAEIPHWLRYFCQSVSEPHDNNWSGIYLDSQNLAHKSTLQLLQDRDSQKGANPALVLLEINDADFENLQELLTLPPQSMKVIPFWVQDHQPLALWDQEHQAFRPFALGQSLLEPTAQNPRSPLEKFTLPMAPLHQEMGLAWSNPEAGISRSLRTRITLVSRAPLLFQLAEKPETRTPVPMKRYFSLPLPSLSHPQTSGIGAKPLKSPSRTPW